MKIIAVDDDKISLDLLNECLSQGGHEHVTLMTSPLEALRMISDTAIAYDCILLDVDMPERSGIQLCADIRSLTRYRNTPILMITRHKDRKAVEQAFAKGATDYITKPFEFFEVLTRIKVAERLVHERQAALDSYIAVQAIAQRSTGSMPSPATRTPDPVLADEQFQITGDKLLSLSVFQNYVEQVTRADDCATSMIAVKIRRIDRIFANTDAVEFTRLLKRVADAVVQQFGPDDVFVTHAGNGVFLCAAEGLAEFDPAVAEAAVQARLDRGPQATRAEIVIGTPLLLTTTPKLNFRRAAKATTARMEQRDLNPADTALLPLSG